ncbi:RICIN domain-containing protein [Streptomyces viridosporus]|uniref:RICIN domain-containing protein n=1 Tax=Streptomyces viridosporus TaxID=67581 RepID=UPI003332C9DC
MAVRGRAGESQNPGAVVQRSDRKGGRHQRSCFRPSGTPGLFVTGGCGKYRVGARNASVADGTPMVIGHCQGPGRHFRRVDRGNDHGGIVEAASGKCPVEGGRREAIRLGACGNTAEPYPSRWTPRHDRQYHYTGVWG